MRAWIADRSLFKVHERDVWNFHRIFSRDVLDSVICIDAEKGLPDAISQASRKIMFGVIRFKTKTWMSGLASAMCYVRMKKNLVGDLLHASRRDIQHSSPGKAIWSIVL
jgi:hypothetical protein